MPYPAGRIWWMARKAKKILGPGLVRKYYSAVAIMYAFSNSGLMHWYPFN